MSNTWGQDPSVLKKLASEVRVTVAPPLRRCKGELPGRPTLPEAEAVQLPSTARDALAPARSC